MGQVRNDSEGEHELRVADEPHAKKGRSPHASFWIVQESVDAGVGELRRNLLDEEKVRVEPA